MTITRIETNQRMSRIVKHNGVAYLCGQTSEAKSVADQTSEILAKIEDLLAKAGSDRTRILQCEIWLADMADFAEMNAVWDAWLPKGHAPARACGEAKLARDVLTGEMIVTAAYE
jgi:enamine deaminase RidA (YjgF/YER057c/UK114 family)